MDKMEDLNLEEVKNYLKANGLDENLANSSTFVEKFSNKTEVINNGYPARLKIYFDKEKNLITSFYRNILGRKTKGADTRIIKEGKIILIEELYKSQESVHYMIDDPIAIGKDLSENTIKKITYYLDENAETQLAKEIRKNSDLNHEIEEKDLYNNSAKVTYEINEEALKDRNPSDYHSIIMMKKVSDLQENINNLRKENQIQRKMLEKSLTFAQTVRNSAVGNLFFGKKAKEVLGEKNKNTKKLPEGRE